MFKPNVTLAVRVSNSTVPAAVTDNQPEMTDLNSSSHPGSTTFNQTLQLEMNLYDLNLSDHNYGFIETFPNRRAQISSDLTFYQHVNDFHLTSLKVVKTTSNRKAEKLGGMHS